MFILLRVALSARGGLCLGGSAFRPDLYQLVEKGNRQDAKDAMVNRQLLFLLDFNRIPSRSWRLCGSTFIYKGFSTS
jgi:hypothetical protein